MVCSTPPSRTVTWWARTTRPSSAIIITLQGQTALGITDQSLTSDVQSLTAFSQAKDLTSQQLALLDQSMSNTPTSNVGTFGDLDFATESSLQVDYAEEFNQEAAFQAAATQPENSLYASLLGPQAAKLDGETQSDNIEQAIFTVAGGGATRAKTPPVPIITTTMPVPPLFLFRSSSLTSSWTPMPPPRPRRSRTASTRSPS